MKPRRRLAVALSIALLSTAGALGLGSRQARAATSAYIPAAPYQQQHSLSCEAAALHIALAAKGINVGEDWLLGQFGADLRAPVVSGGQVVEWGNPYLNFVGNVDGQMAWTGYGVYESRVVVGAHRAGAHAWAGEGWNPADLYAEVALGNPVVVWVPWSLEPPAVRTIQTWDGQTVWFSGQEHAQTLIGFDQSAGTITLDDPLTGSIRTFSMSLFEQRFAQFHSSAVVVGSPSGSPISAVAGADGGLWVNHGGGWSPAGGALAAPPAVAREEDGTPLYIVTGSNRGLWMRGDTFDWRPLSSSPTSCRSGPGAALSGHLLVVACEGDDGALWVGNASVTPGQVPVVPGFSSLGGQLGSAPAVAFVGGQIAYMVTQPPAAPATPPAQPPATPVWERGDGWGWTQTALSCVDSPALASQDGAVLFACHGADAALWYSQTSGSLPTGARSAGGVVSLGVGAAPVAAGFAVDIMGSDTAIWETRVVAGTAQGWSSLGGVAVGGARTG